MLLGIKRVVIYGGMWWLCRRYEGVFEGLDMLFFDLGIGFMGVISFVNFIELYIYECVFFCVYIIV